jgi:hypothetical protein
MESDAFGEGDDLERDYNDYLRQQHEPLTREQTEAQNAMMLRRQSSLRAAAEYVARELALFPEVERVALFGSVTQPLKKRIPHFSRFRRNRISVLHECNDVDLAVWTTDLSRLKDLQRARRRALNRLRAARDVGLPHFQVGVHILEHGTDRYRGRLCHYAECPKARTEHCLVDGCGAQPFLRQFREYTFDRFEFWDAPKEILFERNSSPDSPPTEWPGDSGIGGITDDDVPF